MTQQKHQKNQKHKNANKQTKIKNMLKNISGEKGHLFAYLRFWFGLTKHAIVTAYIQTQTNLVNPGAYPDLVSPP